MNTSQRFKCRVDFVGNEQIPVLIVDNFFNQPEILVESCIAYGKFNNADSNYPGLRAEAPDDYVRFLYEYLHAIIYENFALKSGMVKDVKAYFSIVTTPPSKLKKAQCIPHFDSLNRFDLAAVHYLCDPKFGGTSLYRHRSTGFESLDKSKAGYYFEVLDRELANHDYPNEYMNGSNCFFEKIASYEAVYNRIIVYPCNVLHSGNINTEYLNGADPRNGRLTLNTFIGT